MARRLPTIHGLMAEFDDPNALVAAAYRTQSEGYRRVDAYSPFPIEELHDALGIHHTRLPLIVLIGGLTGWMDLALAIDATRVARLRAAGYDVWTQTIPAAITPQTPEPSPIGTYTASSSGSAVNSSYAYVETPSTRSRSNDLPYS